MPRVVAGSNHWLRAKKKLRGVPDRGERRRGRAGLKPFREGDHVAAVQHHPHGVDALLHDEPFQVCGNDRGRRATEPPMSPRTKERAGGELHPAGDGTEPEPLALPLFGPGVNQGVASQSSGGVVRPEFSQVQLRRHRSPRDHRASRAAAWARCSTQRSSLGTLCASAHGAAVRLALLQPHRHHAPERQHREHADGHGQ